MHELKNHVIVCGYGLVGEKIADILEQYDIPFVVIEQDKDKVSLLEDKKIDVVLGDATSSKTLREAGIEKARAVAIALDNDAKNLFTIITVRSLNDKVIIATRANDETLVAKFKEAGAGFVATPNRSASDELFRELTKGI